MATVPQYSRARRLTTRRLWAFMEATAIVGDSVAYTQVYKQIWEWECRNCHKVWPTRHEAEECTDRKHSPSYVKYYGRWVDHYGNAHHRRAITYACIRDPKAPKEGDA